MALLARGASIALLLALTACPRTTPASADGAATATVAPSSVASVPVVVPGGAPLARLVPAPHVGPRVACPLALVPGVSFGPIALGETLDDLKRGGLAVTSKSEGFADVTLGGTVLHVALCEGKIIDIWLDDLREAPACVTYDGKPIAPAMAREDLEKLAGGCVDTEPAIGGAFESCQGGGLYVGHGMGTFLQLRVKPKGYPFREECAFATDDGSPVALSAKEKSSLLRQTLNLGEISRYWHPDKPGRDPLRLVRTPLLAEEKLTMFGSPVTWIDEAEAKKGTAFFTVTKIEATKTKATVTFAYPVEGVVGTAFFKPSIGRDRERDWRLERASVAER